MELKRTLLQLMVVPFLCVEAVCAAGIVEQGPLTTASYWTTKNTAGDKIIMTQADIAKYNQRLTLPQNAKVGVVDMESYPMVQSREAVKAKLSNYSSLRPPLYHKGKLLSVTQKEHLKALTNISTLPQEVRTVYGVTVRHTSMRNIPFEDGLYEEADDHFYDDLQDTVLEPGEPVAILHNSADGKYAYVQMYNVGGWVLRKDLATCSHAAYLQHVNPEKFLVVVDKDYLLSTKHGKLFYLQGAKIPLTLETKNAYFVLAPTRNKEGALQEELVKVQKTPALHKGYLDYTSNNVLREAFKFYGNVYGWGGSFNSVDCSALVDSAYRTMGFNLPRNSGQIKVANGDYLNLDGYGHDKRQEIYAGLRPGATMHMPGHVMIYLGQHEGKPYVLHAASSYYVAGAPVKMLDSCKPTTAEKKTLPKMQKIYVRRVLVSDLELHRKTGKTFADSITTVHYFDLNDGHLAAQYKK
jgi:cell wall-associated NlpC family hydrolase